MSGPKRGTWRIFYDPTPQRLADLSQFAMRQDAWLERHGSFVGRFLGNDALAQARAALTSFINTSPWATRTPASTPTARHGPCSTSSTGMLPKSNSSGAWKNRQGRSTWLRRW